MAADAHTFSIQTIGVNGEPFATVDGLRATDPVSALADKLCDALDIPRSHAKARLNVLLGVCQVSLSSSDALGDVGIGPGAVLTAILKAEPQVFEYSMMYQKDCLATTEKCRLLLLADKCFLIRRVFDPDDNTGMPDRPMQWDVLVGSHGTANGVATCSWKVHLRRTIVYHEEEMQPTRDSGWEKMDERASFKWRRLEVAEKMDCTQLEETIASMSLEELKEALKEDARSNDVAVPDELDYIFQDFEDDNTRSLIRNGATVASASKWGQGEECDDLTIQKHFLLTELMKLYKGQGSIDEILSCADNLGSIQICSALAPGKVLGPSPCWLRLEECEEKKVCAETDVAMPGVDCGRACLLGIQVNDISEKPLDLTELPQLLGLRELW